MAGTKPTESELQEKITEKRVAKCPGCKTPNEEHHWGIPSKFCDGREKSSPKKEPLYSPPSDEGYLNSLREELEALVVEEQALRSTKEEERKLKERIEVKRRAIHGLSQPLHQEKNGSVFSSRDLPRFPTNNPETPLDDLLSSAALNVEQSPPAAS